MTDRTDATHPAPRRDSGRYPSGPARRPSYGADRSTHSTTGWLHNRIGLIAVAAVLLVLAATVGQPVVAQVLDSFRSEQVHPVVVEPGSIGDQLAALEGLADVTDIVGETLVGDLDDLQAAARLAQVPAPDLAEIRDALSPRVHATSAVGARIAFRSTPDVPKALRGVVVGVVAPGAMIIGDVDDGELAVAVARAIEITASGASLDQVRDALLTEVELPTELRDQLAAMDNWRTALPVPVPTEASLWDEVNVAGSPGLAIGHGDELGAIVWQEGDIVRAVGGQRGVDELLRLAGSL